MENFEELRQLESLFTRAQTFGEVSQLSEVSTKKGTLPIWSVRLGPDDPTLPTLGLFGGVHGLERVGSHVVINYLEPLLEQLEWDENLQDLFKKIRLVSIPIVNPGGMLLGSRSNPNGVDVMRNAPIEGDEAGHPLISGHSFSPLLPWYRGEPYKNMEIETQTLIDFVKCELLPSRFSISLDVHSGFGMRDRLWYPYSHTKKIFPYEKVVQNLTAGLKSTHPFHFYKIEPQTDSYLIHGDPWDYLFDLHEKDSKKGQKIYIPWCLEMGSWTWLKKNPRQLFSKLGAFNPVLPHRYGRIMRRHRGLLDFFRAATLNYSKWRT